MGLEELEEALLRQRQDFAEKDLVGVIAKVLEVERGVIARVIHAYDMTRNLDIDVEQRNLLGPLDYGEGLDRPIREAIKLAVDKEVRRARIAYCIPNNIPLVVETKHLVQSNYQRICDGCVDRLRCIADNLSTPEKCVTAHRWIVAVHVISLRDTVARVKAEQPRGEFEVDIMKLRWGLTNISNPFPEKK